MAKRPGVTILEVLSAAMILVVSLVGISTAATAIMRKSRVPNLVEQATLLATDRLAYFRAQADPYRAVGGTHYIYRSQDPSDFNASNLYTNDFNNTAHPFVREYLYGSDEGQMVNVATGADDGRANQRQRTLLGTQNYLGQAYSLNQVPPTVLPGGGPGAPTVLVRVACNPTGWPDVAGSSQQTPPSDATMGAVLAPRANNALPPASGQTIPPDIKFVREVWVQTNHQAYTGAAPIFPFQPTAVPATMLPPYTVAVTVRVFELNRQNRIYTVAAPGYKRDKPLATVVGYFSLKRILN